MASDSSLQSGFSPAQVLKQTWATIKELPRNDESKFRLLTTFKIVSIPIVTLAVLSAFLWLLLTMDLYFFEAHGVAGLKDFKSTYFDYVLQNLVEMFPWLCLFLIMVVVIGMYISVLIMRPFKLIGDYCEGFLENEDSQYDPDFFTDLKLLTRFSEFFFTTIGNAKVYQELKPLEIPKKYTRIHQPVFESGFMIQYSLFIIIISIATAVGIMVIGVETHDLIISLAQRTLPPNKIIHFFLDKQKDTLAIILWGIVALQVVLYGALALHLYQYVASPAFGIFATMRSFLKGNYSSRVHLIGHYYLRGQCRKFNKYLDYIQKKWTEDKSPMARTSDSD
ncbi:MAG: hypothetical protein HN509_10095 [Halobacteriovoraceae bacterium]|jgi:hypothetical protein|nr:hypothetical protein [Halobacteriovoraceae bacterium]